VNGTDGAATRSAQPTDVRLDGAITKLAGYEDPLCGGFGGAPKFPVAPALSFLLAHPRSEGLDSVHAGDQAQNLALRTLKVMGASPLRDPVEGGFFRYAVNRDWSEPHYERMLYDNAQLLSLYTRAWMLTGEAWARSVAVGIADFLCDVLQLHSGGFASAQDSESTVNGVRVEGGYYALEQSDRLGQTPPALDAKVLTGWNGLAIHALARAGFAFDQPHLIEAARRAAEYLQEHHERADGSLVRASVSGPGQKIRLSEAKATLEDYGMYSRALLELALVTGDVTYALRARHLVESTLSPDTDARVAQPTVTPPNPAALSFVPPDGCDPVLMKQGRVSVVDPSEGAYPSGLSAVADAALMLYRLTGDDRFRLAAGGSLGPFVDLAPDHPLGFGAALRLFDELRAPSDQLVVVSPDQPSITKDAETDDSVRSAETLKDRARRHTAAVVTCVSETQAGAFADAGFDLFVARTTLGDQSTGYLCRDFVCQLPVTDPARLDAEGLSFRHSAGVKTAASSASDRTAGDDEAHSWLRDVH